MVALRCLFLLSAWTGLLTGCGELMGDELPPATPAGMPGEGVQEVQVDPAADVYDDTDPSALTDFRASLDGRGTWVEDPTYGTVWIPSPAEVGPGFVPFETAGHWELDDPDYVWVSDYEWGWGPFHYGRWMYGPSGWFWVPGRVYAPAWVDWRVGAVGVAFIGWAPMAPAFYWHGGVAYATPPSAVGPVSFTYCAHGDVFQPALAGHVVARGEVAQMAGHTVAYGHAGDGRPMPSPQALGISPSAVVRVSPTSRGIQMAKAFARPSTAKALGAHPPAAHRVVSASQVAHPVGYATPHGAIHGGGHVHGPR